jgi:two-component system, LuxR family, response regulator FixJ
MMTTQSSTSTPSQPAPPAGRQIFLVDDNDSFRSSTRWLLEGHGFHVDAFSSPRHFLAYLDTLPSEELVGCILLDIRMPEMSGLEVQEALRQRGCPLPVVFISGHGDIPLAVEVMRKGATHFLEKPFDDESLVSALHDATDKPAAPPASVPVDDEARTQLASLTARERQVLDLVLEGQLNKTIADRLGISIKTVELHRSRVMAKMHARSIAQLVQRVLSAR